MEERTTNFNIEKSRNGLSVPYMNGVYLHSIYNPKKEAELFADENKDTIKKKSHVLILGLGFGYHIEEVAKEMNNYHSHYEILVLEPNKELINTFMETRPFEDKNIKVIHLDNNENLYSNHSFVKFLMNKPSVLRHEASFSVSDTSFKDFLKFKSSESTEVYKNTLSETSKKVMNLFHSNHIEAQQEILNRGQLNYQSDYLVMAFNKLIKNR